RQLGPAPGTTTAPRWCPHTLQPSRRSFPSALYYDGPPLPDAAVASAVSGRLGGNDALQPRHYPMHNTPEGLAEPAAAESRLTSSAPPKGRPLAIPARYLSLLVWDGARCSSPRGPHACAAGLPRRGPPRPRPAPRARRAGWRTPP